MKFFGSGTRLSPARIASSVLLALAATVPATAAAGPGPAFTKQTLHFRVLTGPNNDIPCDIVGDLYRPAGTGPDNRVPAILTTHGFGQSKATQSNLGDFFAPRGYAVLAYSGLGFGGSSCKISMNNRDFDGKAASQLISFLGGRDGIAYTDAAHQHPVRGADFIIRDNKSHDGTSRPDDPRVGMVGPSYGGHVQYATAAMDSRLDTIVPWVTWHDLSYSLAPNGATTTTGVSSAVPGAVKVLSTIGLFAAGVINPGAPGYSQDPARAAICPNFVAALCSFAASATTSGTLNAEAVATARANSVATYADKIRIPTLIIQGQHDSLFNLNEARASYDALRARGTDVKMIWASGGHSGGEIPSEYGYINKPLDPAQQYLTGRLADWFGHYLQGTKAPTGPALTYFRHWVPFTGNARPAYAHSSTPDPGKPRNLLLSANAALVEQPNAVVPGVQSLITPPAGIPTQISVPDLLPEAKIPGAPVPGTATSWTSAAQPAPLDVVGAPQLSVRFSAERPLTGAPEDAIIVFAKIYDVAPDGNATVVNGLVTPVRILDPAKPVTITLSAIVHRFNTGHRLRLELSGGDTNFRGGLVPHQVSIAAGPDQRLSLPVVG